MRAAYRDPHDDWINPTLGPNATPLPHVEEDDGIVVLILALSMILDAVVDFAVFKLFVGLKRRFRRDEEPEE